MAGRAPLIGPPPGIAVGERFDTRAELRAAEVHRELQAGICGRPDTGAESVVLAGGYVDDRDRGDRILYTGAGGRDPRTGRQIAHQSFGGTRAAGWNRALAVSCDNAMPVRVVRGHQARPHGPPAGYRYDGLWRVERYWPEPGADGWRVVVFALAPWDDEAITGRRTGDAATAGLAEDGQAPFTPGQAPFTPPDRVPRTAPHRDPALALAVKRLYDHRCQACGARVETAAGPYAEAAHIRPLAHPHDGPDALSNLLCLCPTCHASFDRGGIVVDADGVAEWLDGTRRPLRVSPGHGLDRAQLAFHRALWRVEAA